MKKLFCLVCASAILTAANSSDFDAFKANQSKEFGTYSVEFETYKKLYDDEFNKYKKQISKKFKTVDVGSNKVFVEYDKNFDSKKLVDYEKGEIKLEVIAKNNDEAKVKIEKLFKELMNQTSKEAYQNDLLEQVINQKLGFQPKNITPTPLIADVFSPKEQITIENNVKTVPLVKTLHNNNTIFTLNVKMPSEYLLKKAATYKQMVLSMSEKTKIASELIFAIMHTESSFNPMAKSNAPAYGLMQIVPTSAGLDVNRFLFQNNIPPSSDFLYEAKNNILFGSTFLHLLWFKSFEKIVNEQSRLYCTICAYNTGAGNVARTFVGTNKIPQAIVKINTMSEEQIYQYLLKNLPYSETRDYLMRVHERISVYKNFLKE